MVPQEGQEWSENQVDMFTSVCEYPTSRHCTTWLTQFIHRSILVKCRFKGDTSETSFWSLCKMAILAQERAVCRAILVRLTWFFHGSLALSVLFKIEFKRVHTIFDPKSAKIISFFWSIMAQNRESMVKMAPKITPKWHQNNLKYTKRIPKRR